MLSTPIKIYQNKKDKRILIQPARGQAVIYDDGVTTVLGSGIVEMNFLHDKNWKQLMELDD